MSSQLLAQLGQHLGARVLAAPGPKAPPGTQKYADDITSWVKWGALTILAVATIASIAMLVWGRSTHHPRGARLGFDGLMICIVGAVLYVVAPGVISSITAS